MNLIKTIGKFVKSKIMDMTEKQAGLCIAFILILILILALS